MSKFADCNGNEWKLHLTYGSASAVQRETGVNLALASQSTTWVEIIFNNPGKLIEVLWVLCEQQATHRALTPEQFAYGFDGETIEAAGNALAECVADFFPRSAVGKKLKAQIPTILKQTDERMIAALDKAILTGLPSVSNSPASAESIPEG